MIHGKMAGTLEDKSIWDALDEEETLGEEVLRMPTDEIVNRTRLMDNEIKIMKSELMRITHELQTQNEKIKDNAEKIKVNKTLPYLVSNVIELLDVGKGYTYKTMLCILCNYVRASNRILMFLLFPCNVQSKKKRTTEPSLCLTISAKANVQ